MGAHVNDMVAHVTAWAPILFLAEYDMGEMGTHCIVSCTQVNHMGTQRFETAPELKTPRVFLILNHRSKRLRDRHRRPATRSKHRWPISTKMRLRVTLTREVRLNNTLATIAVPIAADPPAVRKNFCLMVTRIMWMSSGCIQTHD